MYLLFLCSERPQLEGPMINYMKDNFRFSTEDKDLAIFVAKNLEEHRKVQTMDLSLLSFFIPAETPSSSLKTTFFRFDGDQKVDGDRNPVYARPVIISGTVDQNTVLLSDAFIEGTAQKPCALTDPNLYELGSHALNQFKQCFGIKSDHSFARSVSDVSFAIADYMDEWPREAVFYERNGVKKILGFRPVNSGIFPHAETIAKIMGDEGFAFSNLTASQLSTKMYFKRGRQVLCAKTNLKEFTVMRCPDAAAPQWVPVLIENLRNRASIASAIGCAAACAY